MPLVTRSRSEDRHGPGGGGAIGPDGFLADMGLLETFQPPGLAEDEVHVWFEAGRADDPPVATFESLLDAVERERAGRFVFAHHRDRFVRAHGFLRLVLSAYAGQQPETLSFEAGPYGKPALADAGGLSFSLSHSGEAVALAVARGMPVGIDIETARPMQDRDGLVDRFFSTGEIAAYSSLAPDERDAAFFRLWTRKEAFVKGIGLGLSRPLDSFTVGIAIPVQLDSPDAGAWSLHHLAPGDGLVGALAVRHPTPVLRGGRLSYAKGRPRTGAR